MWQDIVIMIANILFSYALIPQIIHGFKTKITTITLQTSTLTTIGLYTISVAFITLNLIFSAAISILNGTL